MDINTKLKMKDLIKKKKINLYSHVLTPSNVGNKNDLYIAWGINTAGNIANMQGKNVLYFDNAKLKFHPFAKKKIIITDELELYKKVENFFNKKEKFILKKKEINDLNEFCDFKANNRAAFVFEKVFELLNKNLDKKKVLNITKENYQSNYGVKKIVKIKRKSRKIKMWEREISKINQAFIKYKK